MAQRSMLSFLSKQPAKVADERKKRKGPEAEEPNPPVIKQKVATEAAKEKNVARDKDTPIRRQPHSTLNQALDVRGTEGKHPPCAASEGINTKVADAPNAEAEKVDEILYVYKKRPKFQVGEEKAEATRGNKRVERTEAPSDPDKDRQSKRMRLLQAVGADDCAGPKHSAAWQEAAARFDWLDPGKIRDKQGRRPNNPDYDARTVKVPDSVMAKLSGTQKEYWKTKQDYMDIVLFFKVGSFYELYELDAEIGIKEFGWKLTLSGVGKCRQVGVPASGVDEACRKLVARGYKVGRVEQTETGAEAKAKRGPSAMVQRKLLRVESPALLVDEIRRPEAVHLLAVKEVELGAEEGFGEGVQGGFGEGARGEKEQVLLGFAFVDAAAGRFYVGEVRDDSSRAALGALLAQIAPLEIVHERHGLSADTRKLLRRAPASGSLPLQLTPLDQGSEFLEPAAALAEICAKGYFGCSQAATPSEKCGLEDAGPSAEPLKDLRERAVKGRASGNERRGDGSGSSSSRIDPDAKALLSGNGPSVCALWALICHLKRLKVANEMLPRGELSSYAVYQGSLRLDGQTLQNLELLQNAADGGKAGTLLAHLDSCVTAQGKRLLRRWICHPLRSKAQIAARQDAVEELVAKPDLARALRDELRKLPDMERLLGRVKAMASAPAAISCFVAQAHQKQVTTFCATLRGLQQAGTVLRFLHATSEDAALINPCIRSMETHVMHEAVDELASLFDWPKAGGKDGTPKLNLKRVESATGNAAASGNSSGKRGQKKGKKDDEEDELSREVRAFARIVEAFADRGLATWGSLVGEALARLDVLISFAAAAVAAGGPTCRPIFVEKAAGSTPGTSTGFGGFDPGNSAGFGPNLSTPSPSPARTGDDVMLRDPPGSVGSGRSNACEGTQGEGASGEGFGDCRTPSAGAKIGRPENGAVLQIEGLWHPYAVGGGGGTFVPNDLNLGGLSPGQSDRLKFGVPEPRAMLLTGPNMGGKSTLLRATCLAVIMAQLGCRIPAERCTLSIVDTIFTRLGATDRIFSGESTFLVECSEAASVLRHATPDSVVVLDELGRGTSTFDGYSIAYAVLKHLSETLDCRLLFATHYHPLTAEFAANPRIKLAHMACQMLLDRPPPTLPLQGPVGHDNGAETPQETEQPAEKGALAEADSDDLQKEGQLVFLYKLRPGPCPKSYGLQVATLAGIPQTVIRAAASAARVMEGKLEKAFSGASRRVLDLPCQEESAIKGKGGREKALSGSVALEVEKGSAEMEVGVGEGPGGELRVARELLGWKMGRGLYSGSDVGKAEGRSLEHEDIVRLWHELQV